MFSKWFRVHGLGLLGKSRAAPVEQLATPLPVLKEVEDVKDFLPTAA